MTRRSVSVLPAAALAAALVLEWSAASACPLSPSRRARDDQANEAATEPYGDVDHLRRARRVVDRALAFLKRRVQPDGSIATQNAQFTPKLATTALGALAFMASGHTADDGEQSGYAFELRRTIQWLLTQARLEECQDPTCPHAKEKEPHYVAKLADPNFTVSQMHGHGYATWALAMAYGMSLGFESEEWRQELRSKLQGAVHCIERAQNPTGGWMYSLEASDNHEGSVTVTVLQALRAAKEAGIRVDTSTIDDAVKYLRNSQIRGEDEHDQGAFRYRIGLPDTSFALTAAAVSSLNATGVYDSRNVDLGIAYMREHDPLLNLARPERWTAYSRFYAAQAYWQYKELRHFRQWYPRLVAISEQEQHSGQERDGAADPLAGSFSDADYGDAYATAMAALTLAIPFGYLPSFQR